MRKNVIVILLSAFCLNTATGVSSALRHHMSIEIDPAIHSLTLVDRVTLPVGGLEPPLDFLLNAALTVQESDPSLRPVPLGDVDAFFGINSSAELGEYLELERYRVEGPSGAGEIILSYSGTMDFGHSDQKEEYTRGFLQNLGILSGEGVFLGGSGFWYLYFNDRHPEVRSNGRLFGRLALPHAEPSCSSYPSMLVGLRRNSESRIMPS